MFSIDGTSDTDLGITALEGTLFNILPETREKTLTIPGKNGLWDFGADLSGRMFEIPCMIQAASEAALQTAFRTLANALVTNAGKPADVSLIFDHDSAVTYTVRYAGNMAADRLEIGKTGKFVLQLWAADPYGYGPDASTNKDITTSGDAAATITINNTGNVEILPVITVKNNGASTLEGFTVGSLVYAGDLLATESVIINSDSYTLTNDGANDLKNMTGSFPVFDPGNDTLIYSDSAASRTVNVKVDYNLRYI